MVSSCLPQQHGLMWSKHIILSISSFKKMIQRKLQFEAHSWRCATVEEPWKLAVNQRVYVVYLKVCWTHEHRWPWWCRQHSLSRCGARQLKARPARTQLEVQQTLSHPTTPGFPPCRQGCLPEHRPSHSLSETLKHQLSHCHRCWLQCLGGT